MLAVGIHEPEERERLTIERERRECLGGEKVERESEREWKTLKPKSGREKIWKVAKPNLKNPTGQLYAAAEFTLTTSLRL